MAFIPVDKKTLVDELKRGLVEIVFVSDDNVVRNTKCTLGEDLPKQSPEDLVKLNEELNLANQVVPVWDILTSRWGFVPLDRIISVQMA